MRQIETTDLHAIEFYRALPKVDLHRHLEGSLRLRTLVEIGRAHGISVPATGPLRQLVLIGEQEAYTVKNFLSKFDTLRLFYRSPEIIERLTRETIADAAADNVRYLELRFTPIALSRARGFPLTDVIGWVDQAAQAAGEEFGIQVRLIVSVNRHEGPELAEQVARLTVDYVTACSRDRRSRLQEQSRPQERSQLPGSGIPGAAIVGLDLAGNEASYPAQVFAGIFREARQAGLHLTAHAGEWCGAQNVVDAIVHLDAERIGHGVRVLEDPQATALARERQTPFEVCITSNYQSGVVAVGYVHPLPRMAALGLNVTINTDDPSISQIQLSDEYYRACNDLGLSLDHLRQRVLAAAQAAFLPEEERQRLIQSLAQEFPQL
jgi:adenosine deaminase